jgi:hypothetical protein
MAEQKSKSSKRGSKVDQAWSRDLKTRGHFYYLKRFYKMEQQHSRSKLELLIIAVIGGCVMYYGAILLVSLGLWCQSTFYEQRSNFKAWVISWDTGPIEITLEPTSDTGGIVLANDKEVDSLENAIDYLFIQSQDLARCKARLGEIIVVAEG